MPDWSLIRLILRNIGSRHVNRDMIGHTVERVIEPVEPAEASAFAVATGDANPAYAVSGGPLPPMYIAKLVIPALKLLWRSPGLNLNPLRTVHAEQTVTWHRTVCSGDPLTLTLTLADIRKTGAGELVELTGRCFSKGELAVEGTTGLLVRLPGARRPKKSAFEPAAPPADFRIPIRTWEGQQFDYARASGDRNVIHTSEILARAAGLPRTILHGACALAMACAALTRHLADGDVRRIETIAGRFSRPVIPGRPMTLIGRKDSNRPFALYCVVDDAEKPVIQNGRFGYDHGNTIGSDPIPEGGGNCSPA